MKSQFLFFALICLLFNACHKKSDQPNNSQTSENISQDASSDFLYQYTQGSFNFISTTNSINQTWPTALDSGSMYSYNKTPFNTSLLLLISNKKSNPTFIGDPDIILDLLQTGVPSNYLTNHSYSIPNSKMHCSIRCFGGLNYDVTNASFLLTTLNSNIIEGYVDGKFEVYNANTGVTTSNIQGKLTFNLLK